MKTKFYFVLLVAVTAIASPSFAQTLVKKMSSANGDVYATYKSGSSYYIGGNFNYVGLNTQYGALSDTANDYPNMDFPQFNGNVYALVPDGSGGWYAGGYFTSVGGVSKSYLAHIKSDNSVDANFNGNCNGRVNCILKVGGRLYIGGYFSTVNGTSRQYAAALNATTGALVLAWNPSPNYAVNSIAAVYGSDTTIWLGGNFTTINTTNISRPYLAAVNSTNGTFKSGALSTDNVVNKLITRGDSVFVGGYFSRFGLKTDYLAAIGEGSSTSQQTMPSTNGSIRCIIPDGSGGWYVGGAFTQIGNQSKSYVAHVKSDKSVDPNFTANCNSWVLTMVKDGLKLYLGGYFTTVNGSTRNYLAAVNSTTGALNNLWTPSSNNYVSTLALADTTVVVGGTFTSISGKNTYKFAVLSKTSGKPVGGYPGFNSTVNKIAVRGDSILTGGAYYYSAFYNPYSAAITTLATNTNPNPNFPATNGSIYCVVKDASGNYYVGGSFTQIGGFNQAYIAKLNSSFQVITAWAPVVNSYVRSMVISGTTLVIGGSFTTTNAASRPYISALNTVNPGNNKTWNSSLNYTVNTLALDTTNSTIYAGGQFSLVNGTTTRNLLAKFTLTGTLDASWDPNAAGGGGSVEKLAITGTNVLAGGSFTTIKGVSRTYLAKLNKTTGASVNWATANSYVYALYSDGTTCYVGGYFNSLTSTGGVANTRYYLGGVTISNGTINSFNPSPNSYVYAISKTGTNVYYGGQFTSVNGTPRGYLAATNASNNTLITWNPSANNSVGTLFINGTTVILGGNFSGFKETARSYASIIQYATKTFASWAPTLDNQVYDITYNKTKIFIGGSFHTVNGSARNGLAAFGLGGALVGTNLNLTKSGSIYYVNVWNIYANDSIIYVGGDFDKTGSTPRNNFVEAKILTGAGTILATNPKVDNTIYALNVQGSTIVYGGEFRFSNYTAKNFLGVFRSSTGIIGAWNPSPDYYVADIALNYNKIIAVGAFDNVGGVPHPGAAAFNLTSGALLTWNPQLTRAGYGIYADLNAVAADSNNVYLGGYFDQAKGVTRNNAAIVSATNASLKSWNTSPSYIVRAIAVKGSKVFIGGDFTYCKGATRNYIAKIDSATGLVNASWNPGANGYIYALAGSGSNIFVGGSFSQLGGLTRTSLGAVNANTGAVTTFDPVIQNNGGQGTVGALAIDTSNILYVGGTFTTAKAAARNNLAAFGITGTGALQTWNPNANGAVNAIVKKGTTIYVGGAFSTLNGSTSRNRLAAVNNTNGTVTTFNPNLNGNVNALSLNGITLYVGGQFTYVNNNTTARNYLASYNTSTGNLNTWNPVANSYVFGLANATDTVYIGGYLYTLNGISRNHLGSVRAAAGTVTLPFNPDLNYYVWDNFVSGHVLLTGGNFNTVGGKYRSGFAVFILPGGKTSKNSSLADDLYVSNVPQKQLMLYPNPASYGTINLKLNEAVSGKFVVKISGMDGRQVYQQSYESYGKSDMITIKNLNLKNGVYIVSVVSSSVNWSNTLIIEK